MTEAYGSIRSSGKLRASVGSSSGMAASWILASAIVNAAHPESRADASDHEVPQEHEKYPATITGRERVASLNGFSHSGVMARVSRNPTLAQTPARG